MAVAACVERVRTIFAYSRELCARVVQDDVFDGVTERGVAACGNEGQTRSRVLHTARRRHALPKHRATLPSFHSCGGALAIQSCGERPGACRAQSVALGLSD